MAKGIGVPDLHLEQIEKIKIIVPPKEIQKKIIEHWKCYEEKITRLKLRIETIENTFNKIIETNLNVSANRKQRKYFKIRTNDLRERSDVEFYTEAERIDNGQKKSIPLSRLCWNISSGQRPKGGVKYSEGLIPNFGGEHITQDGRINYNNMKYISNNFYKKRLNIEIAKEDILICKDGATTGKVAIIDENFKYKVATINEHLLKLSILDGFDPYYVYAFLNSKYGQTIIKRFISGGAQGGIVQNTMDLIRIPEVSKEIQTYIGEKSKQVNRMKNVLEDKLFKINSEQKQVVEDILMKSEKFDK